MSSKFVLQQEDGTVAGGNARGDYAVDLQMSRSSSSQVAASSYSVLVGGKNNEIPPTYNTGGVIVGGENNALGNRIWQFIGGGQSNRALGDNTVIAGGKSNYIGDVAYSTISGGQSNTASTNTHTTVVGGYQNTASGQYSVAGGYNNVASGQGAVALGYNNTNGVLNGIAIGKNHILGDFSSTAIGGESNTVRGRYNACLGGINNTVGRFNSNGNINLGGELNSTNATSGIHGITGGFRNTTNADYAIALGRDASATGDYSFAISGTATAYSSVAISGTSYLYGAITKGNPFNATPYKNNAQITDAISRKIDTLSSGGTTVLSLDGTGITNLIIPDGNNRAWNVTVKWVAVCTATGSGTTAVGDVAIATDSFMFKKVSGTSSIGSVQNLQNSQDATMAGATCSYAVGGSQDLQITFTAPASANATTFRVVAKVELTEVAW